MDPSGFFICSDEHEDGNIECELTVNDAARSYGNKVPKGGKKGWLLKDGKLTEDKFNFPKETFEKCGTLGKDGIRKPDWLFLVCFPDRDCVCYPRKR